MATATTSDVDEIRRKMARIRRELHEDVRGVVESAEEAADWRHYIRTYPWAAAGAAVLIGYLIVPGRRKPAIESADLAKAVAEKLPEVVPTIAPIAPALEVSPKGWGLLGSAFGMLWPIAWKAVQNYGTHFVSNWIAQQQQDQMTRMMASAGMGPDPHQQGPGPQPQAPPSSQARPHPQPSPYPRPGSLGGPSGPFGVRG